MATDRQPPIVDVVYDAWKRGFTAGWALGKAEGLEQIRDIRADIRAAKTAPTLVVTAAGELESS